MSHAGQLTDEAVGITDSHWQLIAESIPHIVWTAASDGRVEYLNQLGNDYTGWSPEVTYNRDWLEVLHPDDVRSAERIWRNASRMGTPYTAEYRIRRTDGEYRWLVSRGLPVRDASGQIVKWIGTATDNHDQRTNEARLREAHRTTEEALTLLATIQAEAPVGFGFVDRDRCLVRLNQELASMTGADQREMLASYYTVRIGAAYHGETTLSQRELQRVVSKVRGGGHPGRATQLTEREEEVLACMREGLSNGRVAQRLGITSNTVRNHVQRILFKLNVQSKLEAVAVTSHEGLRQDGQPN